MDLGHLSDRKRAPPTKIVLPSRIHHKIGVVVLEEMVVAEGVDLDGRPVEERETERERERERETDRATERHREGERNGRRSLLGEQRIKR